MPFWNDLPLLPLRCILQHLNLNDAVAATSTCRNWRTAIYSYDAKRKTVKLHAKKLQKSLFLARLYRKYVIRLHIYLDCCGEDLENFIQLVLPQYYTSTLLKELVFIGKGYTDMKTHMQLMELNSPVINGLVTVHMHTVTQLTYLGINLLPDEEICSMEKDLSDWKELSVIKTIRQQRIISKCNTSVFSSLRDLCIDYDYVNTEVFANFPNLKHLHLNLVNRSCQKFNRQRWSLLDRYYPNQIEVTLNIIAMPSEKFRDIIDNVLVADLPLVALRVLFCKTIHCAFIKLQALNYSATLRELQWVDSHFPTSKSDNILGVCPPYYTNEDAQPCDINPLLLVCWLCGKLEKLVIHGYWIWQYDVLGIIRLRQDTLKCLEISAIYHNDVHQSTIDCEMESIEPVFIGKGERFVEEQFVKDMRKFLQFKWTPTHNWSLLHPALGPKSNPAHRSDYILKEILPPLGVT